jgi:hypothetical protein
MPSFWDQLQKQVLGDSNLFDDEGVEPPPMAEAAAFPNEIAASQSGLSSMYQNQQPTPKSEALVMKLPDSPGGVNDFWRKIAGIESGGIKNPYAAQNPSSSAAGKYQFIWSEWSDNVAKFAGRPVSKEEFLANPKLQESFASHYNDNVLEPEATKLEKQVGRALKARGADNHDKVKALIHFLGQGDTKQWARTGEVPERVSKNNINVKDYISRF